MFTLIYNTKKAKSKTYKYKIHIHLSKNSIIFVLFTKFYVFQTNIKKKKQYIHIYLHKYLLYIFFNF